MKSTVPEPFASNSRIAFDCVGFIELSVRVILESIVKLEMFTVPVPLGIKFILSLD